MLQNYELLFVIGTLGTILSFCLLLVSIIKGYKALKIMSGMLICAFVVTFSTGIAFGYYNYENSKKIVKEVPEEPLSSGAVDDPILITEKSFSEDANYYYSEFEIKNDTNLEISKISFDVLFTDKFTQADLAHTEHLFLLDSVIPPKKTVIKNYIWKKYSNYKKLDSSDAKLVKIQNLVCFSNVNGSEQSFKLADLKSLEKSIK